MSWEGAYLKMRNPKVAEDAHKRIEDGELPEGVTFSVMGNLLVFKGPPEAMKGKLQEALRTIARKTT